MRRTRREVCALAAGSLTLISGCAAVDNIAKEGVERAQADNTTDAPTGTDTVLLHEQQRLEIGPGEVHGEMFDSTGENRLEFTVDGLSYYSPGFIRVFTAAEWQNFRESLESNGTWDGGTPLYDSHVSPGPQTVMLSDVQTYVIALGLKQRTGFGEESTPEPVTANLEYWVYD